MAAATAAWHTDLSLLPPALPCSQGKAPSTKQSAFLGRGMKTRQAGTQSHGQVPACCSCTVMQRTAGSSRGNVLSRGKGLGPCIHPKKA